MGFKRRAGMSFDGSQFHGKNDRRQGRLSLENLSNTKLKEMLRNPDKKFNDTQIKILRTELKRRETFAKK